MKIVTRKWLVATLALVAGFAAVGPSQAEVKIIPDVKFAALSQSEQNLAIYDAFCAQLDEYYFDPKALKTPEWKARFAEFREKAALAPDALRLAMDVFFQLQQKFPHSHISVMMPANSKIAAAKPVVPVADKAVVAARADQLMALFASGPGFDSVKLRRGMGWATVVGDVVGGSPADRAGIQPGWSIPSSSIKDVGNTVRFEGEFLRFTAEEAREFERGFSVATSATSREQVDAKIAAQTIKVAYEFELLPVRPPFETRKLPGDVTYVRFDSFLESSLVDQALAAIDAAGPAGLIVDLRHNSGGLVSEVRRVMSRLLGNDAYIGTTLRGWRVQNLRTDKNGPSYSGPLAVLIGPSTGSGAEVSAAAVIDNKRGPVIGRMTNGSVLTSYNLPLPGGWQVQVPGLDYVRGGDRRIEGVGVEPDIYVMPTLEDVRAGRDPVIERALVELRK